MLEFCSMSILRSRKLSSREDTVSQVRQRVSEVRTPSNRRCTIVAMGLEYGKPEDDDVAAVVVNVAMELDTGHGVRE